MAVIESCQWRAKAAMPFMSAKDYSLILWGKRSRFVVEAKISCRREAVLICALVDNTPLCDTIEHISIADDFLYVWY
jgi:hypothetical protein